MRIDVFSIFPEYLNALDLSLIGKARRDGVLDVRLHDLREHTHDRHRTVDDTPYGGGAGMVMKPEPWAQALDALVADGVETAEASATAAEVATADAAGTAGGAATDSRPVLIVPGPAGERFTQAIAAELAQREWLAFACGRYEGIDERVYEYAAAAPEDDPAGLGLEVRVLSLGDYVLNGGEVAVLAMVEAIGRLLPGVVGNAESLVEESHSDSGGGLLEYPSYTKPASWRGRDVPPVLLGGNHAAIATWRRDQSLVRTAARRPDLLGAAATTGGLADLDLRLATPADAGELMTLTRAAFAPEFARYGMFAAGEETRDEVVAIMREWQTWVGCADGRIVVSVRVRRDPDDASTWQIGRLVVAPDLQGRGLGRELLAYAESLAPSDIRTLWLNTGKDSERNLRIYRKAGYRVLPGPGAFEQTVNLTKPLRRS